MQSPLYLFSRLDNGKYADLRFECVCLKYRKCCGAQGGKRGGSKRGGGYAERATFHEGLEHFVKYYVFTKKQKKHTSAQCRAAVVQLTTQCEG